MKYMVKLKIQHFCVFAPNPKLFRHAVNSEMSCYQFTGTSVCLINLYLLKFIDGNLRKSAACGTLLFCVYYERQVSVFFCVDNTCSQAKADITCMISLKQISSTFY